MMLIPAASDQATSTMYTGTRTMSGIPNALSKAAIESGNIVYPIILIDWKKELGGQQSPYVRLCSHVTSEELDLKCYNSLPYPNHEEHAREDLSFLLILG